MSNMETRTEAVDYTQFVGTSYTRTPQIRYDWKIDANNDLKVALEYTGSRVSAFPTLTGRYSFKQGPLTLSLLKALLMKNPQMSQLPR